ncbi:MAG: transposase [Bacteroidia bacterium]|nr:transposase [Bacteroidia bacterium]
MGQEDGRWSRYRSPRYLKKGKEVYYGYKRHHMTDEHGFILKVSTTPANVYDGNVLWELLSDRQVCKGIEAVAGDKAYRIPKNEVLLKRKKLKNLLMFKGYRKQALNFKGKIVQCSGEQNTICSRKVIWKHEAVVWFRYLPICRINQNTCTTCLRVYCI